MFNTYLKWIIRQPERENMGKKDVLDRAFFADKERFAELINNHLYQGEKIILPNNLVCKEKSYPSLLGSGSEKNRDILMVDVCSSICYGLEIETESDYSMPERTLVYDSCEYEQQIREIHKSHLDKKEYRNYCEKKSRMKRDDYLQPTVTVVLYLGEGHWKGRKKLSDMFQITDRDKKLLGKNLQDYSFPLIEADFINCDSYRTDLKEFFQAMQCRRNREGLKQLFLSENFKELKLETERVIAVHLHVKQLTRKMEKEKLSMCKAFNELMKEERKECKRAIIRRMLQEGLDEALIIKITECTKQEFVAAIGRG